jgi:hypothetical protein
MDENSLHPKFQESLTIGLNLKICHLNIDGISASKSDYLSHLMREHKIDIVARKHTQLQILICGTEANYLDSN